MKKLEDKARYMQPPDVSSMYAFLFFCIETWKNTDLQNASRTKSNTEKAPLFSNISPALKYSIIINSYSILDAVINTYVLMNGYELDTKENEISVHSKWKNFPWKIEKKSFSKQEIKIIDEIRILRNQIAHPKVYHNFAVAEKPAGRAIEMVGVDGKTHLGYLPLESRPRFNAENAFYLVNEVTRLLILANKTLSNTPHIPDMKIRVNKSGKKWPADVLVN